MPLDSLGIGTTEIIEIDLASVVERTDLYPRQRHDPLTVERYAALKTPAPPVLVNQDGIGIDYKHRMLAARERGERTHLARVLHTLDDADIFALGIKANLDHGLILSNDDKRQNAKRLYDPSLRKLDAQKRNIAALLRVDVSTVYRWLETTDRTRRDRTKARILELHALGRNPEEIGKEVGRTARQVRNVIQEKSGKRQKFPADVPEGFVPELYNMWDFTRNTQGIDHFGKTDPRLIENCLYRFAPKPSDVVLDLFAGSGTSIDVCREWGRACLAFDRKPRHARGPDITEHDILTGLPESLDYGSVRFVFLDPPYWKQAENRYSDGHPNDLSHLSLEEYEGALVTLIRELRDRLPAGAVIALLIQPTQWNSGPAHETVNHVFRIPTQLAWEPRYIQCRLGKNATPTMLKWAKENREVLEIGRTLLVWRVPELNSC